MAAQEQRGQLEAILASWGEDGICIAFSGGVDSALLVALACRVAAGRVHAVTMQTPFHSLREPEEAAALARQLGAVHHIIAVEELDPRLAGNPKDRCYICKKWIFEAIGAYAAGQGLSHVVDGTNADDLLEYRPGLRALRELGVHSPLAELGIGKAQVRELAGSLGISVAKKPSAPCLATRFPYGTQIPLHRLPAIDGLERGLRELGFEVVRARVHGDILRLEVPADRFPEVLGKREAVVELAKEAGFRYVSLDLEGFRSGSMDLPLAAENPKE